MSFLKFKTGQKVDVGIHGDMLSTSIIDEVVDKDIMIITHPLSSGGNIELKKNQKISLEVITDLAIYSFESVVVKVENGHSLEMYRIKLNSKIKRIQRRGSFRLKSLTQVEIFGVGVFNTYDISEGGLSFLSRKEMNFTNPISGSISLRDSKIVFDAVLVRVETIYIENDKNYKYAFKFDNLPRKSRDKMAKYVMEKQRENR